MNGEFFARGNEVWYEEADGTETKLCSVDGDKGEFHATEIAIKINKEQKLGSYNEGETK